jgi:hypothetical protein
MSKSGLSPKNKPNCGFQRLFDTTNKAGIWQREENENSHFFFIFYDFFFRIVDIKKARQNFRQAFFANLSVDEPPRAASCAD